MAFRSVFKGVLGGAAAVAVIVALPLKSVFDGADKALEDNPEGKSNILTTEYHKHNWEQFKEGGSFGIYEADKGVSAENTADIVYDAGKSALESGGRFLERIGDRLEDDLGVQGRGKDLKLPFDTSQKPVDPCAEETFSVECFSKDNQPEPPEL